MSKNEKLSCGDPAEGPGFTCWNKLEEPCPHVAVTGVVTDGERVVVLKRGNGVRSARNCWSLLSGLVDVGESVRAAFAREVREETGLALESPGVIDVYDNILFEEKWHWTMILMQGRVSGVLVLANLEPDKHEIIKWVTPEELLKSLNEDVWQESMRDCVLRNWHKFEFYGNAK